MDHNLCCCQWHPMYNSGFLCTVVKIDSVLSALSLGADSNFILVMCGYLKHHNLWICFLVTEGLLANQSPNSFILILTLEVISVFFNVIGGFFNHVQLCPRLFNGDEWCSMLNNFVQGCKNLPRINSVVQRCLFYIDVVRSATSAPRPLSWSKDVHFSVENVSANSYYSSAFY